MKAKEFRQKTEKELKDLLQESRYKLGGLQFDLASKKLKNIKQITDLRRDIARILTILNQSQHEKEN